MKDGGWEESSLEFINIYKVVHNKHPGFSLKQKLNHLKNLGSSSKESACNMRDPGSIPGSYQWKSGISGSWWVPE